MNTDTPHPASIGTLRQKLDECAGSTRKEARVQIKLPDGTILEPSSITCQPLTTRQSPGLITIHALPPQD